MVLQRLGRLLYIWTHCVGGFLVSGEMDPNDVRLESIFLSEFHAPSLPFPLETEAKTNYHSRIGDPMFLFSTKNVGVFYCPPRYRACFVFPLFFPLRSR